MQTKVLLRTALESLFSLRACLDDDFCEKLITADLVKRKKTLRKAEQLVKEGRVKDPTGVLDADRISRFESEVAAIGARYITTAEIAKAADLYDMYLGVYAMLSTSVHSTVHDIERNMAVDAEGGIKALMKWPDLDDCAFLLICATELLLMASMVATAYFDFDFVDYWNEEYETLRMISEAKQAKLTPDI